MLGTSICCGPLLFLTPPWSILLGPVLLKYNFISTWLSLHTAVFKCATKTHLHKVPKSLFHLCLWNIESDHESWWPWKPKTSIFLTSSLNIHTPYTHKHTAPQKKCFQKCVWKTWYCSCGSPCFRSMHDFSEETLDLVTEISLNLSDSQSTGKGLRKDQSLSFQLELFHYSWMWYNYKRCWMWNLIRIIWHSSWLKKSPQLLLWLPKCDGRAEDKSTYKVTTAWPSLASLGHFVTCHKYQ